MMRLTKPLICLLAAYFVGTVSVYASINSNKLEEQRSLFLKAEKKIKKGDFRQFEQHKKSLSDYPLLPYLDYAYLTKRLSKISDQQVADFIAFNADTPLANRLRYLWLKKLARSNKHDKKLIQHFQPTTDTVLECRYRSALIRQGQQDKALEDIERIWLVGKSQPDACDPVFNAWKKAGGISKELRWQRIELAMQKRKTKLANYLARDLPAKDRKLFKLWLKVHRNPKLVDSKKLFTKSSEIHLKILTHGVYRLAFRDVDHAKTSWKELQQHHTFPSEDKARINRTMALLFGQNHHADALPHLNAFDPELETQRIREWRVRAAIRDHDWPATLATIGWLSEEEKLSSRWLYWRARALEELGFITKAQTIYRELVTERSYHSFLAADRLQLPYTFANAPANITETQLEIIEILPGIQRAKELYKLDRLIEARREWEFTSQRLNDEQLLAAAKLAESWEWHSSAIFTAARIAYWDDIPLRFPLGHKNSVIYQANKYDIEPAWVYGILRQESAFVTDARSNKGALGLMQLMPTTGKYIARRNKTPYSGSYDLLVADKNIKLGSAYLKDVRKRLYDHPVLATAAYNAGYTRVKRWLPDSAMQADIWIETIPYDETRDYLERVLAYTAIYDWRLNPEHQNSLVRYMTPVSKPETMATNESKDSGSS